MATLSEVDDFPASLLVGDFLMCQRCGVVDRERKRIRTDAMCPSCQHPAGVARLYYHVGIQILIDMIQQAYNSKSPLPNEHGPRSSDVAVVLFFCTLREALLDNLLNELFSAHKVAPAIAEKLLKDNRLFGQKLFGVLPAITEAPWKKAIEDASSEAGRDFVALSAFMEKAADLRNTFVHKGSGWGITRDLATECVNSIFDLMTLFASLHNLYVKPHFVSTTP